MRARVASIAIGLALGCGRAPRGAPGPAAPDPAAPVPSPSCRPVLRHHDDPWGLGLRACVTPVAAGPGEVEITIERADGGRWRALWRERADGLAAAYLVGSDDGPGGLQVVVIRHAAAAGDDDPPEPTYWVIDLELVGDELVEAGRFRDSGD